MASSRVVGVLAVGVKRAAMSPETFCNVVRPSAVGHTPE